MKSNRQTRILELVSKYPINKQDELLKLLKNEGFDVTQSTISRDIKNLRLTKVLSPDGTYRYQPPQISEKNARMNFSSLFSNSVLSVNIAQNIIVIKTSSGMANAVCVSLDLMNYDGIVGTLAGDDTIFAACKDSSYSYRYYNEFRQLM